jgi:hypothetical protein
MTFSGVDVLVERSQSLGAVEETVSELLGVAKERVVAIEDFSDYPAEDGVDVVCVVSETRGDFRCLVSIQTKPLEIEFKDNPSMALALALALRCRCLIPDAALDPYTMLLAHPEGRIEQVALEPEEFDRERYVVKQ